MVCTGASQHSSPSFSSGTWHSSLGPGLCSLSCIPASSPAPRQLGCPWAAWGLFSPSSPRSHPPHPFLTLPSRSAGVHAHPGPFESPKAFPFQCPQGWVLPALPLPWGPWAGLSQVSSLEGLLPVFTIFLQKHRIMELFGLEDTSKINKSKYFPNTDNCSTNPCLQAPHLSESLQGWALHHCLGQLCRD